MNLYLRKDGRFESRIPNGKKPDGKRAFLYVLARTKEHQAIISQDMESKIISMYAKGMSVSDIEKHIRDIYGLEISDTTVSRITDKVLPAAKEW